MNTNEELREQIRLITFLCWRLLAFCGLMLLLACLFCWCYDGCTGYGEKTDTLSVRIDSVRDTVIIYVRDTVPTVRRERVVRRLPALELLSEASVHSVSSDTVSEGESSDTLTIVQREYSDDSTYTAYVSGIRYGTYPRLDSITVCQRTVTERVRHTVTLRPKSPRWNIGLIGGYGYGFKSKNLEPFIGVGVTISLIGG